MITAIGESEMHHFDSEWTFLVMGDVKANRVIAYGEGILALDGQQPLFESFSILLAGDAYRDHTLDPQLAGHVAAETDYVSIPDVSRLRRPKHLEQGHRVDIGLFDCMCSDGRSFELPDGNLCTFAGSSSRQNVDVAFRQPRHSRVSGDRNRKLEWQATERHRLYFPKCPMELAPCRVFHVPKKL